MSKEGKNFWLQEMLPLTTTHHPSVALLGVLLRLEKKTCQLLSRMGLQPLLSIQSLAEKKTIEANFHPVLFMIPCSTFWEPSPYPEAPGDEIFVVSPHL